MIFVRMLFYLHVFEGSLEVKLPTVWTYEKQRWEQSEKRREKKKKEDQRTESEERNAGARKVGKS